MIVMVGNKAFVPFKCVIGYLGEMVSENWLRANEGKKGFPTRVSFSERKTGFWQAELDAWIERRNKKRGYQKKKAA